jgi:DeoR family transcriptional regulator of aga operon
MIWGYRYAAGFGVRATSAAHELEPAIPRFSVVLSGGTLRLLQHSLVDPMGGRIIETVRAETGFLSCSGIHVETGVSNWRAESYVRAERVLVAGVSLRRVGRARRIARACGAS